MARNGKKALATDDVLPLLCLCGCTHIIPGNSGMQYVSFGIYGKCRLPHAGNSDGHDAFRVITTLHGRLNALQDCSPYVFRVKFAPFRHWMAYDGAAAAHSIDTTGFYVENDRFGIRGANIDASKVHG